MSGQISAGAMRAVDAYTRAHPGLPANFCVELAQIIDRETAAPELLAEERHSDVGLTQIITDLENAEEAIADANLGKPEHPASRFIRYAKVRALVERDAARAAILKAGGAS